MNWIRAREYDIRLTENTIPAMRYNLTEDYHLWNERATKKLYDLLRLPFAPCDDCFEILSREDCAEYRKISFTFQSEQGYFVPAAMLMPLDADGPRPAVICIQGHTSGMHISEGIRKYDWDAQFIPSQSFALQAVREGFCAVMLEQRYMGVCGSTEDGYPLCSARGASLPALLLDRCAVGERVWDVQRTIDILETYFKDYADLSRLICMGNSGGGITTFYASCVDPRIRLSVPACSVCELEDSFVPKHHCACSYIPGIRKYFEMGDMACLLASRKLILVCGIEDIDFPLRGVEKSYDRAKKAFAAIGRENLCRLVKGAGGHDFYPEETWPIIRELL